MARSSLINWLLYAALMVGIWFWLASGKPFKVTGMFLASGLAIGSLYALGGIGMVVLYRASGVLNFSSGAAGAAGALTAWQLGQWGLWAPLTWLACIAVALLLTLGYGRLIAPGLAWRETVVKAVATLGFALIVLGLVSFLWIDDPRSLELPTDQVGITLFGLRATATRLLAFAAAIGIAVAIHLFLSRTETGLQMRAVANSRDLSALLGIPILRVETIAWGISGLLAGFTGLMFANLIRLEPVVITFMVIPSVAAALTGRLNSLALVLVGGLSMGVIESLLTLSPTLKGARPIAPFVIAALVLLWTQRNERLTLGARLMGRALFRVTPSGAAGLVFAAFCLVVLPSVAGSYWLAIFTSTACFAMAISGVAFMYARLGMVSLTQVGLMGIGGWVTLRLNYLADLPFEANLILAALATMICGWIMALPALRMRGLYLALVTLMAAGGLEILFATYQFPNGGEGFWGVKIGSNAPFRGPALAQTPEAYLRYVVVVSTLGFLFIEGHRRLFPGRAWALIRRSEAAAMAAGVNVTLYKTWAFGIAGAIAGVAGGLLAGSLGLLDDGTFRSSESIMVFALAVVGGARFWLGAVIAAVLYRVLPALLNSWGVDSDLAYVIFGAGLLHALITAPDGIAGQIMGVSRRLFRRGGGAA